MYGATSLTDQDQDRTLVAGVAPDRPFEAGYDEETVVVAYTGRAKLNCLRPAPKALRPTARLDSFAGTATIFSSLSIRKTCTGLHRRRRLSRHLWLKTGSCTSRSTPSTDPTTGGEASFSFTVARPGNYALVASVDAPADGSDSFWVNIDDEPTSSMIWDIDETSGFEERTVSVRENQGTTEFFHLAAGEHTVIIHGREMNTRLRGLRGT